MEFSPEIIGSIAAAVTAISAALVKFVKWSREMKDKVVCHFRSIKDSEDNIKSLLKEVRPNGGSSMRDSVNRIETKLSTVEADVSKIQARQYAGIDMSESPIFEIGKNGQCIHANPSFLHLIGRSLEEVLGHNWKNSIHQEDEERVCEAWDKAVENDTDFRAEYRLVSHSKETIKVSVEANRQRYAGKTLGWMGRVYPYEEE